MKLIIKIFTVGLISSLFIACDEDDSIINSDIPDITLFDFMNSPASTNSFVNFIEASENSIISDSIAQSFGISTAGSTTEGYAIKTFAEDGVTPETFFSVADILDTEGLDITVFAPETEFSNAIDTEANRFELGNLLLYHMVPGRVFIDSDFPLNFIPFSSNGSSEIIVSGNTPLRGFNTEDGDPGRVEFDRVVSFDIRLNSSVNINSVIRNLDGSNGVVHLIDNPLALTPFQPVPVVVSSSANEQEDGTYSITFSRVLDSLSITNTLPSAFNIVVNDPGQEMTVPISSISLDEAGTTLTLTPSENVSNKFSDVTLNYTRETIRSAVGAVDPSLDGALRPFDDLLVRLNAERVFDFPGDFEDETRVGTSFNIPRPLSDRTGVRSFIGGSSLRVSNIEVGTINSSNPTGNFGSANYSPGRLRTSANIVPVVLPVDPTGIYRFEYAVFIEDLPVLDASNPVNFEFRVIAPGAGGVISNPAAMATINVAEDESGIAEEDRKKGKWQLFSFEVPGSTFARADRTQYRIVITNPDIDEPNPYLFYMDEIRVYRLED